MRIPFKAWYFVSTIDEKKVREKFADFTFESNDPLTLKIGEQTRVLISGFGAVVFWPFDESAARMVAERIRQTLSNPALVEEVEDRLVVETNKGEEKILFNEIWLASEPTGLQMKIIAMLLAQSVALDYLENEADSALERFSVYLDDLRKTGRIRIRPRSILKAIGFAMRTRHEVLANLALFDKPSETWESESLEKMYKGLHDFFDLPERQLSLSTKLDFLAENTTLLFEFLSSRKSQNLEWIVIILIAIELAGFVIYEMLR